MKYTLAYLSLLSLSPSLPAEESVRDMSFCSESVPLTAVPGEQRHLLIVLPEPGINNG